MNIKSDSVEMSERNEIYITGHWKKDNPCCKVEENVTKLSFTIAWKVEQVSDKLEYLADEMSQRSNEGTV